MNKNFNDKQKFIKSFILINFCIIIIIVTIIFNFLFFHSLNFGPYSFPQFLQLINLLNRSKLITFNFLHSKQISKPTAITNFS